MTKGIGATQLILVVETNGIAKTDDQYLKKYILSNPRLFSPNPSLKLSFVHLGGKEKIFDLTSTEREIRRLERMYKGRTVKFFVLDTDGKGVRERKENREIESLVKERFPSAEIAWFAYRIESLFPIDFKGPKTMRAGEYTRRGILPSGPDAIRRFSIEKPIEDGSSNLLRLLVEHRVSDLADAAKKDYEKAVLKGGFSNVVKTKIK